MRRGFLGLLALGTILVSQHGFAQSRPALDLRAFQPSTSPEGSLYLEPSTTPGPAQWNTAGWLSWAYRPVVLRDASDEVVAELVSQQLSFDFTANIGIGERASFGLALPAVLAQEGESNLASASALQTSSLPAQAIGDLAVVGKAALLTYEDLGGFGLAALARVTLPTGDETSFIAEQGVTSELRLLAEYKLVAVALQATTGFKLRTEEVTFAGETWGNEIPWGVGLSVLPQALDLDPDGHWRWVLEARGSLPAGPEAPFTSAPQSPALIGASARYSVGSLSLVGGVEGPLDGAAGVPLIRLVGAIAWAPRINDADRDGVPDEIDECPELAEDTDGFEDSDGCPDFDNDSDAVPDADDRCPGQLEDLDDFMDEDGCPDPDNDGDGVLDEQDACPNEAGPRTRDAATNGCPRAAVQPPPPPEPEPQPEPEQPAGEPAPPTEP